MAYYSMAERNGRRVALSPGKVGREEQAESFAEFPPEMRTEGAQDPRQHLQPPEKQGYASHQIKKDKTSHSRNPDPERFL
jgi:hypothetical protein